MATREEVVTKARECLGTPFKHNGRLVGVGLDCVGVPAYIASSLSLTSLPILSEYPRRPTAQLLRTELSRHMKYVPLGLAQAQPGDVVIVNEGDGAIHVGVLDGEPGTFTIITARALVPRCVVEYDLDARQVCGVFRFHGID